MSALALKVPHFGQCTRVFTLPGLCFIGDTHKKGAKKKSKGGQGAEKLAKQQAAMVTMMRKKKKFAGNGNGFTWSQLPGFSLPHSPTLPLSLSLCLSPFLCARLCACCAFCVSLCAAQLLTVSAFATTMRPAKMSRSLTRLAHFINGTSSTSSPSATVPLSLAKKQEKSAQCCVCPTVQLTSLLSPRCRSRSRSHSNSQLALSLCVCCCGNNL